MHSGLNATVQAASSSSPRDQGWAEAAEAADHLDTAQLSKYCNGSYGAFFSQHIHHMPGFHLIPFDSLEISPGEDGHRHQEQVAEIRGAT